MNQLVVFYLMISAIHFIPMVIITMSLKYGIPVSYFRKIPSNRSSVNQNLRSIGFARFEQLFHLFDWEINEYLVLVSSIACIIQVIIIMLIMTALIAEVPLFFIPVIDEPLTAGIMNDLMVFAVTTSVLQLLPMIGIVLALIFEIPLPYLPRLRRQRPPPIHDLNHWEENSEDFASIRMTRFENSDKTFVFANCRNERTGKVFKLVVGQGKKANARPQCFLFTDDEAALEQIIPAPTSVKELDEIFPPGDDPA